MRWTIIRNDRDADYQSPHGHALAAGGLGLAMLQIMSHGAAECASESCRLDS